MIDEAETYLRQAAALRPSGARSLQAAIHAAWCARLNRDDPCPWRIILKLYDALLNLRDDPIIRINRAVAVAEVAGPEAALTELEGQDHDMLSGFVPYHAVRADLLTRVGRSGEARKAYDTLLSLPVPSAEKLWLEQRRAALKGLAQRKNLAAYLDQLILERPYGGRYDLPAKGQERFICLKMPSLNEAIHRSKTN